MITTLKSQGLEYLVSEQDGKIEKPAQSVNKTININNNESNSKIQPMKHIIHPFVKRYIIKNIKKELIGQTIKIGGWAKTLRQSGEAF